MLGAAMNGTAQRLIVCLALVSLSLSACGGELPTLKELVGMPKDSDGSESLGIPTSSFRVGSSPPQAESESETRARQTIKRCAVPFIAAPSIADSPGQS